VSIPFFDPLQDLAVAGVLASRPHAAIRGRETAWGRGLAIRPTTAQ
jgi:hypothetical protein